MKRLAIIDGKSVFYRGYYAMPNLSMKDGTPTGGVYGFAAMSLELMKKLKPDYVAVAWDKPKTNIRRRKEIYPEYKAGRKPAPPDFYEQIPILHELLEAFGWPLYELDDYEADDIMGALSEDANKKGVETALITSDLDMLQLIDDDTHVYALKKGFSQIEQFNLVSFEEKYGLKHHQFLDLKALQGDSSDNIPGVPGVGAKTATTLLQKYDTLDGIYEHINEIKGSVHDKLVSGKESAYMSKEIARIWTDAPIAFDDQATDVNKLDREKLRGILEKLEFRSLLKNLPDHMKDLSQETLFTTVAVDEKRAIQSFESAHFTHPSVLAIWYDSNKDELWVSEKEGDVFTFPLHVNEAQEKLKLTLKESTTLIGYDLKTVCKKLDEYKMTISDELFDVRHGAFLLDSLRRERSFESLLTEPIDLAHPSHVISSLWQVYDTQLTQFKEVPKLFSLAKNVDFKLIPILARMEVIGVKIDTDFFSRMSKELAKKLAELEQQMHTLAGYEFNIASPSQLADVLYVKLQLPTAGIKKGKTGYSTGQKELDKLRGQHPIIELIEQTREIAKLKNTYVDTLPTMVDKKNRLHTNFRQDVAATGRLSSNEPNLQNIPIRSELGRHLREGFIAEKGMALVSADYSQFELRLAAVLAGDKELVDDFNSDLDIHAKTASDVYGIPLDKVTKNQRRDAKVINFGILYGMSPHGLSVATGMSLVEAKQFIDQYFQLRAPIRQYIDATMDKARDEGYVETLFGRRRPTPDVKSSNFIVREAAKRAAANMPIQGTEADLMKMAMLEIDKKLPDNARQILQIHDSILVECGEGDVEKVGIIMKETMENIYPKLGIKLKVDVSHGKHWGEL